MGGGITLKKFNCHCNFLQTILKDIRGRFYMERITLTKFSREREKKFRGGITVTITVFIEIKKHAKNIDILESR